MIASNGSVDSVRLSLEASSACWFSVVKYAGYAVAAGCALEAPETYVILKRWWLLRFRDVDRPETIEEKRSWIVPLAAAGLFFIVVGIIVETYAEGKVSDIDAQLREHESDKISAAESDATTANDSAKAAADNAGRAQGSADAANQELVKVRANAAAANKALAGITPRVTLLVEAWPDLIRQLKPYHGQKVVVEACGGYRSIDLTPEKKEEMTDLQHGLMSLFDIKVTEWYESVNVDWHNCPAFSGISIWYRKDSPSAKAATALGDALSRVLPAQQWPFPMMIPVSPSDPHWKQIPDEMASPITQVFKDSDLIVVIVGIMPLQVDLAKLHARTDNKK